MIRSSIVFLFLTMVSPTAKAFSWSSPSKSKPVLGKKSTALDVLEELNRSNRLASYVPTQTEEDATPTRHGGVALVTGGNSGIGVETVKTLALTGMHVILCSRNFDSAEKVVKECLPAWCRQRITIQQLDLSDMDSIQKTSKLIVDQFGSEGIDVLLNNAGVMAVPTRSETRQGLELQFGTNHVGHHMLTRLLLPHLNQNGRIVTVASMAHQMAPSMEQWDAYQEEQYTPWGAYGISKLANVIFAKALQDRLEECGREDVLAVSLHPGVIRTNLWRYSNPLLKPLSRLIADKTVEQGAATNVFCALTSRVERGAYYADCDVKTPTTAALNRRMREQLWEYTEKIIAEQGYTLPVMATNTESETKDETVTAAATS